MKLFYLILAHTNLPQVERMINALRHEQSEFYIHFDARVPANEIRKYQFLNVPGITVIKTRYKINWGGYNMVRATLSLMRAVCKKKEAGYLILSSGQDFPIKSPAFIYSFLKKNYGREYLEYFSMPHPEWSLNNGLDRIQYYWFIDTIGSERSYQIYEMQKSKAMIRSWFNDFPPYGGSQWWCITSACAAYILKFLRHNPLYEEYFEQCFISDESFFNTLVVNSPFKENTENNNLKYICWDGGVHPRTITMEDLEPLMQSERLWARKFFYREHSDILDHLEMHISDVNIYKTT